MLKKESERIIKIPKGPFNTCEDDTPNKYPVISEEELRRRIELIEKRKDPIRRLARLVVSQDPSYKASGMPHDGLRDAICVCEKALHPSEEIVSYCCRLPLIYEGTPKSCTVRCPNGCIEEHFTDLDTWK